LCIFFIKESSVAQLLYLLYLQQAISEQDFALKHAVIKTINSFLFTTARCVIQSKISFDQNRSLVLLLRTCRRLGIIYIEEYSTSIPPYFIRHPRQRPNPKKKWCMDPNAVAVYNLSLSPLQSRLQHIYSG
jgi:hypothetical protein